MLVFGSQPETLPVTISTDATSGLPLLGETGALMQYILAYLALPYSVTEHGCGDKTNLIIDHLLSLDIPPHALSRGMILERDMSPEALAETDYRQREHAMFADNPLELLGDLTDPDLRDILNRNLPAVELLADNQLRAGPYLLHHSSQVQFAHARSHIYPVILFWDEDKGHATERVLNPSLHRSELFPVPQIRSLLNAPQALLLKAPLLGHFRLDEEHLTEQQLADISALLPDTRGISALSHTEHAGLIRQLTGAQAGSIGDPETWTYANNYRTETPLAETLTEGAHEYAAQHYQGHLEQQKLITGRGDGFEASRRRLIRAREQLSGEAPAISAELRHISEQSDVRRIAQQDALWSQRQLEPLADLAMLMVYYSALSELARTIQSGQTITSHLDNDRTLQVLRGLGVRLRRRIDWLGRVSKAADGRIDARALTPGFVKATVETITQMNRAGLTVFIDRVGNLHGLLLNDAERQTLTDGSKTPADFTVRSIAHISHIDTVNDAGKFDGRLGVLAGVETAHVLSDLKQYFGIIAGDNRFHTHVSAFIGEEMTFTGEGVSMPGSAAVAGRADPSTIHRMINGEGEQFGERLIDMLKALRQAQHDGVISLVNDLAGSGDDALLDACSDPVDFYTPHTYERHIEQGPILDRADVPIVMVETIMGIYQEDFFFDGEQAEAAALEMNVRMRELTTQEQFSDVRITVGVLGAHEEQQSLENLALAERWTLAGEMNHAGATPTPDRRDPGVAAARLVRQFYDWFDSALTAELQADLIPTVSNVRVSPGTNRNVIPGSISFTLSLADRTKDGILLDQATHEDMTNTLKGYATGTLSRQVSNGGEGVRSCRVEPISYTTTCTCARLSIDLRADRQSTSDDFRSEIDGIIRDIESRYQVSIRGELQQKLPPFNLQTSGQALLMERSYGGSHNPREMELLSDMVRGCVLQLAVTRAVLSADDQQALNLYRLVNSHIPQRWLDRLAVFTSGALHDTCNIAARAALKKED